MPGRMERIDCGQPFLVVVDYAHTPGLAGEGAALLRPLTRGRLMAVFGSAGERDIAKRAIQGRVSQALADITVLTSEDPRFEDAAPIVDEIAAGAVAAGGRDGDDLSRVTDRMAAVHLALGMPGRATPSLLAGKGHEQSIICRRGEAAVGRSRSRSVPAGRRWLREWSRLAVRRGSLAR